MLCLAQASNRGFHAPNPYSLDEQSARTHRQRLPNLYPSNPIAESATAVALKTSTAFVQALFSNHPAGQDIYLILSSRQRQYAEAIPSAAITRACGVHAW